MDKILLEEELAQTYPNHATVSTQVKQQMLRYVGDLPQPGIGFAAAYAAQQAKQKKGQQLAERQVVEVDHPESKEAIYGDLALMNSAFKTERKFEEISALDKSRVGSTVWVRARVHANRGKGKSCFMVLRKGIATVQVAMFASETMPREMVKYASKISLESVVDVQADIQATPSPTNTTQSDIELIPKRVYVVSAATILPFKIEDAMAPEPTEEEVAAAKAAAAKAAEEAAKKKGKGKKGKGKAQADNNATITVGQKLVLDYRWLSVRTPAANAILRVQSAVGTYFRQFFLERGFAEIHTPKLTPGVSEGGADVFRLDYFGRDACLAQSPQLYKQMAIMADMQRVFEVGPVFRAENSNTHRHMTEFVGLDFEMEIYEHYHELLKTLSDLFIFIFKQINEKHADALAAVQTQFPFEPLEFGDEALVLGFPEAVKLLNEAGDPVGAYEDLSTASEKLLGRLVKAKYNTDFYIVDRYPYEARPFYTMKDPKDPKYTNSYDVFIRGEEVTSGAQRVHDLATLVKQVREKEIPLSNVEAYLRSFEHGAPPHGGAGIGLERVTMLFLGLNNIRKSSFFPRTPLRLTP